MQIKRCSKCCEYKSLDRFYKKRSRQDGHSSQCKDCVNSRPLVATARIDALAARRARTEKACSKCGAVKPLTSFCKSSKVVDGRAARCAECAASYRAANKLVQQQYQRAWYKSLTPAERERLQIYRREWRRQNPKAVTAYIHNYKARKSGNGGNYTAAEWRALCEHYGNKCLCCGQPKPLTVDHVLPVSKGGSNAISNIQPLCRPCNSRKWTKHIDYR